MRLIKLTIKGVSKEILTNLSTNEEIISDNIDSDDMGDFFGNTEEYISKYCEIEVIEENDSHKLFLLKNKNPITPYSYDSAVFCAISESTVRKMGIELSENDFSNIEIIFLGIANKNTEPGEICSSYNNGS